MDIYVDASGSGIGATDGTHAYAGQVCPIDDPVDIIAELEGANVVVAMDTFLSHKHLGKHIRVHCDNQAAVSVFTSGRGHNGVLLDSARKAWMIQARLGIRISYVHVPGVSNVIADRLSRAHLSRAMYNDARLQVQTHNLVIVDPATRTFDLISPAIYSRSGNKIAAGVGIKEAAPITSRGHVEQPQVSRLNIPGILKPGGDGPAGPTSLNGVCIHRVPQHTHKSTSNNCEQHLTCEDICTPNRTLIRTIGSPKGGTGARGSEEGQDVHPKSQDARPHGNPQTGHSVSERHTSGGPGTGGTTPPVLLSTQKKGKCPPHQ